LEVVEVPSRFEVDDRLWAEIEPLIPVRERRFRHPGRLALDDRQALNGILYVLHTGIAWRDLPQELGYGSGVTCWRRLRSWQQAGVWEQLHHQLLTKLNAAGQIDWSRAAVDGSHIRTLLGGSSAGHPR
jgi:transposase